eukprot:8176231-Prorocentrum_lima.AAC.1
MPGILRPNASGAGSGWGRASVTGAGWGWWGDSGVGGGMGGCQVHEVWTARASDRYPLGFGSGRFQCTGWCPQPSERVPDAVV